MGAIGGITALLGKGGFKSASAATWENLLGSNSGGPQAVNQNLILANCNLIDSVSFEPIRRATVFVSGGRIDRISTDGAPRSDRADAKVIDLEGYWVLPGLCEAHSHLISPLQEGARETPVDRYIRMGAAAIASFQQGITTIRVVGSPGFADVAWRNAFAAGTFTGPRLFVAGHQIVPTAGHGSAYNYGQVEVADGPDALRKVVREQIQADVDLIKIILTGGVFGLRWDSLDKPQFLPDEIQAVFETAQQRGYNVAAHCGNATAVKLAARAGAHSVEHGYELDQEAVDLMVKLKTIYVPTLCITSLVQEAAESPYEKAYVEKFPLPANLRERANQRRAAHILAFKSAMEAGVRIASGADQSPSEQTTFLEIELLVRYGMKPMQAIIAATRVSAAAAGADKMIGTVEKGKLADLLVVKDSPLDSIYNLRKTAMVIKEGRIAIDRR